MTTAVVESDTEKRGSRRWRTPLVGAMVLGTTLRLLFVILGAGTARYGFSDSESYLVVSELLPRGLWAPPTELAATTLWRTPVYPVFVALTGGSGHVTLVIVAQCLVGGALNVWLAYRLGRAVFGATAGVVAAFVCALDPASVAHSLLIATETLAATWVLLLAIGVHGTVQRVQEQRPMALVALGTGFVGALLALTRPNLLPLAAVAALLVLIVTRRGRGAAAAGLVLLAAVLPVAGWVARNHHVGGTAVLSTVTGQNLVDYGLAAAAHEDGLLAAWATDHDAVVSASMATSDAKGLTPAVDGYTENAATNEIWTSEGAAILREHPRGALVIATTNAVKAIAAPGTGLLESHLPVGARSAVSAPLTVVGLGFLLAVYLAATAGVVALVRERRWSDLGLLVGFLAVALVCSVGPWLYVRFRVPVFPLVAVLAGGGAVHLRSLRPPV